jgi:CheY-like chemotaxis protein
MTRQLRQLSRMVDDLLDVSRVSSGKILLHRQTVNVAELIARSVATTTRTSAAQQEIVIRAQPVQVDADPMRLEQIVTNLLTNAMKYTPAGGSITVTAGSAGDTAVIAVEDTGVGMTPDLVERVFDLFVQGERALARSEGGLGIGLTLVRRLVEMHGGSVVAESDGPGRGSRFTVRLPVATGVPARGERRTGRPVVNRSSWGRRVLVVEDNDDVRAMLRTLLELGGHEVHEAADGPSGLQAAIEVGPDIAFIDIGLPGIDGYQVVQQLRERSDDRLPMLVALTGYGRSEDRQRMEQAGFDAHLIKPVEPSWIEEVMARAVRREPRSSTT